MKKTMITLGITLMAMTYGYSQCACCAGAGIGSSNGDYNNGVLTLPKNSWVAETYTDYRKVNQNASAQDIIISGDESPLKSMLLTSVGLRYGLTKNITLSALLPYVFLYTPTGNDSGLGDLSLMGTFNILHKNNFSMALQAGIELPTGIQKNGTFDNGTIVVGSGSYDPMVGAIFAKSWNNFTLQANGLYKYTTKGFKDNYYGSILAQNLSLSYKIRQGTSFCPAMTTDDKEKTANGKGETSSNNIGWAVFGGYYGEWLDHIKENNIVDENSGYYMGFMTLGNNISYKKWSFPLTLSLPIIQKMNGNQSDGGFRLRLGIIKSF
jgi:hypothetical protein